MSNSTRTIDWETLIADAEGAEANNTEHDAYQFSKKTFTEDDSAGVYGDE